MAACSVVGFAISLTGGIRGNGVLLLVGSILFLPLLLSCSSLPLRDRGLVSASVVGFAVWLTGEASGSGMLLVLGFILLVPLLLSYWSLPLVVLWRRYRSAKTWWPDRVIPRLLAAHCVACVLFYPLTVHILPLVNPALKGNVTLVRPGSFVHALIWGPVRTPLVLTGITRQEVNGPYWWLKPVVWVWPTYLLPAAVVFVAVSMPDWRRAKRRAMGLCVRCGYDLRASKERCPECGMAISTEQAAEIGMGKKNV